MTFVSKPLVDIVGKTFGYWTVESYVGKSAWTCRCRCGATSTVVGHVLRDGRSKSCRACAPRRLREEAGIGPDVSVGAVGRVDITGKRFGCWTVLLPQKDSFWRCQCDCGAFGRIRQDKLISGASTGCLHCARPAAPTPVRDLPSRHYRPSWSDNPVAARASR